MTLPGDKDVVNPVDDRIEVTLELGDILTPDAAKDAEPELALGSDIYRLGDPAVKGAPQSSAPPDGVDELLIAYLIDLDVAAHDDDA